VRLTCAFVVWLGSAALLAQTPTTSAPYVLKGPSSPVTSNAPLDPDVANTLDPNRILTFGYVYTPFIRAPTLQDGLTYVAALPWQRADVTGPERLVDASYIVLTPAGSTDRAQTVQPVWVKPNTDLLRQTLGAGVPERAMLAAFPSTEIRAGREFVIVYAGPVYAQRVTIRAEDVAAWR
jgi:hypothetical protein